MKILCDTHSHTVASTHAYSNVHDYIRDAQKNQLQLISITDHAPSMPDAPHLWHFANMKVIPRVIENIAVLRGIEANILPVPFKHAEKANCYVDLSDFLDEKLDIAIASFHEPVFKPQDKKTHTQAMIRAIESGYVQIIGHPGNPNYPIDQEEVIRAAKDNNVVFEINNSSFKASRKGSEPHCLELISLIDKHDWKVCVGSDAHISLDVGLFERSIGALTQQGFNENNIVNRTPKSLLGFLEQHGRPVVDELQDWLQQLPSTE